jgi:hypothetical protein
MKISSGNGCGAARCLSAVASRMPEVDGVSLPSIVRMNIARV